MKAAALVAGGATPALMGAGFLGPGIYITTDIGHANLYAQRAQGEGNGSILRVFCDVLLAGSPGIPFDAANYPDDPPVIPANLLAAPFFQDIHTPTQFKVNEPYLGHLRFLA